MFDSTLQSTHEYQKWFLKCKYWIWHHSIKLLALLHFQRRSFFLFISILFKLIRLNSIYPIKRQHNGEILIVHRLSLIYDSLEKKLMKTGSRYINFWYTFPLIFILRTQKRIILRVMLGITNIVLKILRIVPKFYKKIWHILTERGTISSN